jgi:hypothetical protein
VLFTCSTAVALAILAPVAIPDPRIDVWHWMQTCGTALLNGIHPYTVQAPDFTSGAWDFGSTPTVMPYMPLDIVVASPFIALFGDGRFALAAALPLTFFLLRAAGRRLRADAWTVDAVTLAWALHPRGTQMIIKSYQEPLLVLALAAFVFFAARDTERPANGYGAAIAFFLLPALKQYVLAPVLMLAALWRRRPLALLAGAAVAAATIVPFVVWNARATLDGIMYMMRVPIGFRNDSDSLAALASELFDIQIGRSVAVMAQFVVGAAAWLALRDRGVGGLLLASGVALVASFLLATQAFFNYYYFAGALLLWSALVLAAPAPQAEPASVQAVRT